MISRIMASDTITRHAFAIVFTFPGACSRCGGPPPSWVCRAPWGPIVTVTPLGRANAATWQEAFILIAVGASRIFLLFIVLKSSGGGGEGAPDGCEVPSVGAFTLSRCGG